MNDVFETRPASPDKRPDELAAWVRQQLNILHAEAPPSSMKMTPLAGDAGFRRYFRLNTEPPLLAVDAPPARENNPQFVRLAHYLRPLGIEVPTLVAADLELGFLLIEDFGDELLQHRLTASPSSAPMFYGEALVELLALQQAPEAPELLPRYDRVRLNTELRLFTEWFVEALLNYNLSDEEQKLIDDLFTQLEDSALEQPQVLVHRDYHSRNLLVRDNGGLGVVDFQDAVWGPITYDPVSLLRDCYIRWPADQVRQWARGYGNMAADAGLLPQVDESQYFRWFDWMGLQRHLKVLGIFSRLALRDGKDRYLQDLPLVIRYIMEATQDYDALTPFRTWFDEQLLPIAEKQSWYRDYRQAGDRPA